MEEEGAEVVGARTTRREDGEHGEEEDPNEVHEDEAAVRRKRRTRRRKRRRRRAGRRRRRRMRRARRIMARGALRHGPALHPLVVPTPTHHSSIVLFTWEVRQNVSKNRNRIL